MDANEGKHLTDEQIDEFCCDVAADTEEIVAHALDCEECSQRIDEHEVYLRALRAALRRLQDKERSSGGSSGGEPMAFSTSN